MIPYPFRELTPPPSPAAVAAGRECPPKIHVVPPQIPPKHEKLSLIPSNAIYFRHPDAFSHIIGTNTNVPHPFTNNFPGINIHTQRVSGGVAVWTTFMDMEIAYNPTTKRILRGLMAGFRRYGEQFNGAEEMACLSEFCKENYELFGLEHGAERVCFACGVDHDKVFLFPIASPIFGPV
jgi:hypothetical protein